MFGIFRRRYYDVYGYTTPESNAEYFMRTWTNCVVIICGASITYMGIYWIKKSITNKN